MKNNLGSSRLFTPLLKNKYFFSTERFFQVHVTAISKTVKYRKSVKLRNLNILKNALDELVYLQFLFFIYISRTIDVGKITFGTIKFAFN